MNEGVSIIVCTNGIKQESLKKCIHSLSKQSLENKEIICVTTTELPMELRELIDIVVIEIKGLSVARNAGIRKANFNIIAFTDDDCICDSNWANSLLNSFTSEEIGGVTGRTLPIGEGYPVSTIDRLEKVIFQYKNNYIPHHIIGHGNNMCFKKDVLIDIGLFDIHFGVGALYKSADDTDIIHKVLRAGFAIVYSPEALAYHEARKINSSMGNLFFDYGLGFGAFCRKSHKDADVTKYFLKNIFRIIKKIKLTDLESISYSRLHISGLLKGYLLYNKL